MTGQSALRGAGEPAGSSLVVVCDFDGTVTEEDVCLQLLDRFAGDGWRRLEDEYESGRIDLQTCLVGQVGLFGVSRGEMVAWARQHARLRPGFAEFVAYCRRRGVPFFLVSAGLDFYIEAILEREGIEGLDITCIATETLGERVRVVLPLAGYAELANLSDFKEVIVREHKARGKRVVYIGDGSTDFRAARHADHVFARDKLLAYCERHALACLAYETFADVQRGLEELLAAAE